MGDLGDTSLGGPGRSFPTTVWEDILAAGDPSSPEYRERLEGLLKAYWKPVFAYVRRAWHKSVEDAKDITQAFFAIILERGLISRISRERGTFRSYLKRALQNFLVDVERAAASRRPTSGRVFSLDAEPEELERLGGGPGDSPDKAYDREWFRVLFQGAIESLRDQLARDGKAGHFEVFRRYCLEPQGLAAPAPGSGTAAAAPSYAEVAAKLGITETDVRNQLHYCRSALFVHLKRAIRDYAGSESDVEAELREVIGP